MKFKLIILLFFSVFFCIKSFSQQIQIGQNAESVKQWISYYTQERTGYDSYGRSKGNNVEWDVIYNNGKIQEVIQCYNNQLITFLESRTGMYANYCTYYIMADDKLSHSLTQYDNLSLEQVNKYIEQSSDFKKVEHLYISDDFKTYYKTYLINGLPTVEWRKLNLNELPESLKAKVSKKIQEKEEREYQKIIAEEKEKLEIEKRKSNISKDDIIVVRERLNKGYPVFITLNDIKMCSYPFICDKTVFNIDKGEKVIYKGMKAALKDSLSNTSKYWYKISVLNFMEDTGWVSAKDLNIPNEVIKPISIKTEKLKEEKETAKIEVAPIHPKCNNNLNNKSLINCLHKEVLKQFQKQLKRNVEYSNSYNDYVSSKINFQVDKNGLLSSIEIKGKDEKFNNACKKSMQKVADKINSSAKKITPAIDEKGNNVSVGSVN